MNTSHGILNNSIVRKMKLLNVGKINPTLFTNKTNLKNALHANHYNKFHLWLYLILRLDNARSAFGV
jgi:hypothetical protein